MASEAKRDLLKDHLLTPQNAAFIIIDYQSIQVSSMQKEELVFNIVGGCKAAKLYGSHHPLDRERPKRQEQAADQADR